MSSQACVVLGANVLIYDSAKKHVCAATAAEGAAKAKGVDETKETAAAAIVIRAATGGPELPYLRYPGLLIEAGNCALNRIRSCGERSLAESPDWPEILASHDAVDISATDWVIAHPACSLGEEAHFL